MEKTPIQAAWDKFMDALQRLQRARLDVFRRADQMDAAKQLENIRKSLNSQTHDER